MSKEEDDGIPSRLTSVAKVSVHEEMNPSFRSTMEDTWCVKDGMCGKPEWGFFGVYDGHGGREVAEYLKDNLASLVEKEMGERHTAGGAGRPAVGGDAGKRSVEECLSSAFYFADIKAKALYGSSAAGATACTCFVKTSGRDKYVYTANCGDARAVLCAKGVARRLSKDHKATDDEEKKRIEELGGFVLRNRVLGVLAVARAFGDYSLKKYVPCTPYTSGVKLDATAQFLIVACDGVWDVLSDEEAVGLVREYCDGSAAGAKSTRAAKYLVDQALARGSTDNVTCMVVFL
uniref:PPM-type phosphatase domain-containing protein n=1 Tax=Bicosoecida sp. CB-2014 TaxID=1486930 RepID=A0A7S1CBR4_9STRA|mmetsp:Transcript_18690/g.66023  ORF Transcript_18690/g.66023 Transcript_18690/m.66023 type:complete len:290 (+) Transcript_18690:243-1112(+)